MYSPTGPRHTVRTSRTDRQPGYNAYAHRTNLESTALRLAGLIAYGRRDALIPGDPSVSLNL